MKFRFLFLVLALTLTAVAQQTHVQDPAESQDMNLQAYIQLLRADLQSQKKQLVAETMQLDEKQAPVFWPLYNDYETALNKLGDEKLAIIQDYAKNFQTMTNEKADQLANRVMDLDDKKNALRRQSYEQMKKSLPTVVVVRFFQVENQIQLLVDLKIAANLPIMESEDTQK